MSTRLSAFILAAGTALAGCSTLDKAAQGAKEDWNRMTASTPAAPASAPANDQRREAPAEVVAAAPSSNVHPRLEAALEKYGSAHVSKGKPDPVSFNTSKCSSELLAGKGPNPVLNRATPGAVQKQAENGAWGAIGGLAGKLPGAAGTAAGRVVQTGLRLQPLIAALALSSIAAVIKLSKMQPASSSTALKARSNSCAASQQISTLLKTPLRRGFFMKNEGSKLTRY